VSIVTNDVAKIVCALFHDRDDGPAFGRLICSEILNAFTQVLVYNYCELFCRNNACTGIPVRHDQLWPELEGFSWVQ
jgi:hypothetical protein